MEWFSDWWGSLDLIRQILYCIAVPGSILLIVQTILVIFGIGGGGGDADVDIGDISDGTDIDGASEFGVLGLFSFQGIVAFLCVFGWSGIVFINAGLNTAIALIIAFALGFGAMYGVARIIQLSRKLTQSGTLNMKLLIGESGMVYIPIPEDKSKRGKVMIQMAERHIECDAVSEDGALAANTPVRVTDILAGNVLVVEKI